MPVTTLQGKELEACDAKLFYYKDFYIVIVSGDGPNLCGHALLNVGGEIGYYVHVTIPREKPRIMNEPQYQTYLKSSHKEQIVKHKVYLPFPQNAILHIETLMSQPWKYNLVLNNCAHFVEKIIHAGGSTLRLTTHCPVFFGRGFKDFD